VGASGDTNKWYVTFQNENSQQPSPRSVPFFKAINSTFAILYGGFLEHIEDNSPVNCGDNIYYNDVYILNTTDPTLINWTLIEVNPDSIAPPVPRAYGCVVYSPMANSLFLYGGIAFAKDFSKITNFADSWRFDLDTRNWTLLDFRAPPGNLSGVDCDIVHHTNTVYLTHGTKNKLNNFQNDTWSWNLTTNTWTLLNNGSTAVRPGSRALSVFKKIPHTHQFLFFDGLVLTSSDASKATHFTDVWRFDLDTFVWMNQTVLNPPSARGNFASVLTSDQWFYMFGGDISTNASIDDNCFPPLECYTAVNPNNEAYFLKLLSTDLAIVDWSAELEMPFSPPPLRHASIAVLPPNLYLTGGMDWSGKNGVGEEYNFWTWSITLPAHYFT